MDPFWNGFEKQARGLLSSMEPLGILDPLNIVNAVGGTTAAAKRDAAESAESDAVQAASAASLRRKNPMQYMLNPTTSGPFTEAANRLSRRHNAAKAESPVLSSLVPFYGLVRGGKAGEDKLKK